MGTSAVVITRSYCMSAALPCHGQPANAGFCSLSGQCCVANMFVLCKSVNGIQSHCSHNDDYEKNQHTTRASSTLAQEMTPAYKKLHGLFNALPHSSWWRYYCSFQEHVCATVPANLPCAWTGRSTQSGRGDSPQLSALVSWQVVVGAQLISNSPKAKVEGKGKQHAQHNGAGNAEPKGDLAGKSQACC